MAYKSILNEELERIELQLRKCREALAETGDEELDSRLSELHRELGLALQAGLPTMRNPSNRKAQSGDTFPLSTTSRGERKQDTHAPSQDEKLKTVEEASKGFLDTVSFDFHERQATEPRTQFGDYEIIQEIAKGGMGVVYKARHTKLNRMVALKMIRSGEFADEDQIKRFHIEAEAAAKLDHSGIVPVYDVGEIGGRHYYSMAFVDGQSLNDRVKNDGPLEPEQAARIIGSTARAVGHAHLANVLHRDLKPHNVLLGPDGKPKVTDFGLAKLQFGDSEMTATGQILGTPSYMPPEQASGNINEISKAADIYSLGATLYFLLTGRPPFQSANVSDTLRQVVEDEPVAPRQFTPAIPRDLETICLKALNKETHKRYTTSDEFADDLQRWMNGEPIIARRVGRTERVWKSCKRRPMTVALLALVVSLLVVGSLVFWERQNASHAEGLVERLRSATPSEVSSIVVEVPKYGLWIKDDLREQFEIDDLNQREKLHVALGLIVFDDAPLLYLQERLLTLAESDLSYVSLICDSLEKHRESTSNLLWETFHNRSLDPATRFRAGLGVAYFVGESELWEPGDAQLLAEQLIATNAVYQANVWPLLESIKRRLLDPLEETFNESMRTENEQLAAANAITFFAKEDAARLTRLLLLASGPQYNILFDKYQEVANEETKAKLAANVRQQPTDALEAQSRIALGKKRATSAITLLRIGNNDLILDVLRYTNDPEALTQFVHRCRARGVQPSRLIELLEQVDQLRGQLDSDRQKIDDSVMYALLLALGEFSWDELPSTRQTLAKRLTRIYQLDPSSGIHSATGWLLRRWGHGDAVDQVDNTPLPYDATGHREWYVKEIEYVPVDNVELIPEKKKFYLTFIVYQPAEYTMGSPDNEPNHLSDETQHQVTLTRPFAVCDRELTWAQWIAIEGEERRDAYALDTSKTLSDTDPVMGISWFGAVAYCRWLGELTGLTEDEQCYKDLSTLPKNSEGYPIDWPIRLEGVGFRLPTEAEWEFFCRSGSGMSFSFGNDSQLLAHYSWFGSNSGDWLHATGELRPNSRGLFDIHGNIMEWCHDWHNGDGLAEATNPIGAETSDVRVCRGGSYNFNARYCRSSYRLKVIPKIRNNFLGFRLVMSLHNLNPATGDTNLDADSSNRLE